jgi:rSAM/selenodomain-associated transferase 1
MTAFQSRALRRTQLDDGDFWHISSSNLFVVGYLSPGREKHLQSLAIFARAPRPGEVKSRLARVLGTQAAVECYSALLRDTLELAVSLPDWTTVVAYTPDDAFAPAPSSLANFWNGPRLPQKGADLGERMSHCLQTLHAAGAARVVIIGSDCPDLETGNLVRAFALLENRALVFGPAHDGGFYLIGAAAEYSTRLSQLFEGVVWSAASTLQAVLENARKLELRYALLPVQRDVDTPDDLCDLTARLQIEHSRAPHTAAWLRSQNLL